MPVFLAVAVLISASAAFAASTSAGTLSVTPSVSVDDADGHRVGGLLLVTVIFTPGSTSVNVLVADLIVKGRYRS